MPVPFVDLKTQYNNLQEEIDAAIRMVFQSTCFVGGQPLAVFEQEFATFCETKYALGVGNGTDALELALQALGIGPGDEVITQANSFIATAAAIVRIGARPVFVDIDPDTYTIEPASIERAITRYTKAIMPVHLYGQPADMGAIMEIAKRRCLYVIEDAAQAHGAIYEGRRVGSLGHVACFSFYPGKNLGAFGDGGAITSSNRSFIERIAQLREHGRRTKYDHVVIGRNSRLDTLQAAILRVKLRYLDEWNQQRQRAARWYVSELADSSLKTPTIRPGSSHVFHLFVVQSNDRDTILVELDKAGISAGIHYPVPLHLQPAFAQLNLSEGALPNTEASASRILSLPMFPEISQQQVKRVAGVIRRLTYREERLADVI